MRCPYCGVDNTRVIDSRPVEEDNSIRRRRHCDNCGKRFTTYEKIETIPIMVVKKDENRELYEREKIMKGLMLACRKRPVSAEKINAAVDHIESEIYAMEEKEIRSSTIGELVMEELKNLDGVAYVRFASVYREFRDVDTFLAELEKIFQK